MKKCFVIQPFDNDKFDKRYVDTFKPAIENADLESYRIDKDPSVRILIEDIEQNIKDSAICLADITIDNPNVWYELGYAFACGKDVVLVCSDERVGKFPFDIQHRQVLKYQTGSSSDFKLLEESITTRIKALLQTKKTVETLNTTPVVEREGLQSHEIAMIIIIAEYQFINGDNYSVYGLKEEMSKAGYTNIATGIGLRTLAQKGFLATSMESDNYNNGEYLACRLTNEGETWLLSNQDKLVMRSNKVKLGEDDDLPF